MHCSVGPTCRPLPPSYFERRVVLCEQGLYAGSVGHAATLLYQLLSCAHARLQHITSTDKAAAVLHHFAEAGWLAMKLA